MPTDSPTPGRRLVLYDGQCEICQGFVSWLSLLDRERDLVDCRPIDPAELPRLHPDLLLDACLRELHVLEPDGRILVGWDAVARLARLYSPTRWIGLLGGAGPGRWIGRILYRFVASNRYELSKCRGGACSVVRPRQVQKESALGAFWSCYSLGMMLRLPVALHAAARDTGKRVREFFATRRRRIDLLGGRLSLWFLGGFPCDAIPLVFGERFVTVIYRGLAVDPGSPKMRRSLARHLRQIGPEAVRAVAATHHHEEHVGNLNWLAQRLSVPLFVGRKTAERLREPARLPLIRRAMIGQPPALKEPFQPLDSRLRIGDLELEVLSAPGHCEDHVVLYDRQEKLLLAGDAFMGAYFSTPNPDVDSRRWIESLERIVELDIEILVEGHGHIHTRRPDVPDVPGVVVRVDPREEMRRKLEYLRWLRSQIEAGAQEGLPIRAIEATCFPWGRRSSWETLVSDELTRLLSLGHFSRSELVRSFRREAAHQALPTAYEAKFHLGPPSP